MITGALQPIGKERLPVFRDYLDSLLSGNYSDFQLKELFRSADTDTSFLDVRDPRYFLAAVRDIIDGKSVQL